MLEDPELMNEFIAEAEEHLRSLEENLLQLEKSPEDMNLVREIFRSAHTLKGNSSYMDFSEMTTLCHDMETILEPIRSGEARVDTFIVNDLLSRLDKLKDLINILKTQKVSDEEMQMDKGNTPIHTSSDIESHIENQDARDGNITWGQFKDDRFLLFEISGALLCLPVDQVVEITNPIRVSRLPHWAGRELLGLVNLRGEIIPLFDVAVRLNLRSPDKVSHYIVGEGPKGKVALAVERVIGVHHITGFTTGKYAKLLNQNTLARYDTSLLTPLDLESILRQQ
ncbi:MAG: chemotaxis protein CheW [Zestosphaera sp.]